MFYCLLFIVYCLAVQNRLVENKEAAKKCVKTYLPNELALKIDGAKA